MSELTADELYLDHFHFTHDPFAARVPGFRFYPAQRKPVLGQLHHLARYSQLLLVVTGPEGSGKTLLRQALVASTNKQSVQTIVIAVQPSLSASQMLEQVAQALGIGDASVEAVLAQVIQLGLTGQEVYLLVDDADRLPDAGLASLLQLAEGSPEGRPHVFLFGQSFLAARLEALAGDEERYHAIELQPYTREETEGYLASRLEGAGRGLDCLSESQVDEIHASSEGWPGPINVAARQALNSTMRAEQAKGRTRTARSMPAWLPVKHLAAVAAVAVLIIAAVLLLSGKDEQTAEPARVVELPLPAGEAPPVGGDSAPAIEFDGGNRPTPLPLAGDAQPVIREPLASAAGEGEEPPVSIEPDEPPSRAPAQVEAAPANSVVATPQAEATQSLPQPAVTQAPAAPAPPPAAERPVAPQPSAATAPAGSSAQSAGGNSWYRAQPGARYLVQVLGTSSEERARTIVREQGDGYRYYVKQYQGKPLYVVTYGSFADRASAQKAVASLPAALRAGKPWVRTFASVQQEASPR